MRVLLDESLPRDLARHLPGHEVGTVQRQGWAGLRNGELLRVARDAGFAVLVTADRNMEHQQRIARSGLALVVLRARSTRLVDLLPLVPLAARRGRRTPCESQRRTLSVEKEHG